MIFGNFGAGEGANLEATARRFSGTALCLCRPDCVWDAGKLEVEETGLSVCLFVCMFFFFFYLDAFPGFSKALILRFAYCLAIFGFVWG